MRKSPRGLEVLECRIAMSAIGFQSNQLITESNPSGAILIDIDGDDDLDILYAGYRDHSIKWRENLDSRGSFGEEQLIASDFETAFSLTTADIDGDGDLDLVAGSFCNPYGQESRIAWFEHLDGKGTFGDANHIDRACRTRVSATDVDKDGHVDLVAHSDSSIFWYHNDGTGGFGDGIQVDTFSKIANDAHVVDLDQDGYPDIVSGNREAVSWYRNTGSGFTPERVLIEINGVTTVADVNGDEKPDIVVSSNEGLFWLDTLDLERNTVSEQSIETGPEPIGIPRLDSADLNGDGQTDIILLFSGSLAWMPNRGDGEFDYTDAKSLAFIRDFPYVFAEGDIDGDGDLDWIASSLSFGPLIWRENRPIGDANGDNVFDSSDLVLVFQAGEYEDAIRRNSIFSTGDWNGDGDFDSSDLVIAFQEGAYLDASRRQSVLSVWPSDGSLLVEDKRSAKLTTLATVRHDKGSRDDHWTRHLALEPHEVDGCFTWSNAQ